MAKRNNQEFHIDAKGKAATHPLDLLPGHRALGAARPLLGVLVHELTTCGTQGTKPTDFSEDLGTNKSEATKLWEKIVQKRGGGDPDLGS